jgi:hypothetical protein
MTLHARTRPPRSRAAPFVYLVPVFHYLSPPPLPPPLSLFPVSANYLFDGARAEHLVAVHLLDVLDLRLPLRDLGCKCFFEGLHTDTVTITPKIQRSREKAAHAQMVGYVASTLSMFPPPPPLVLFEFAKKLLKEGAN